MEAPAGSIGGGLGCPMGPPFFPLTNGNLFSSHETMFGQNPLHNTVITHGKDSTVTYGVTTVAPPVPLVLCPNGRRSNGVAESKRSSPTSSTAGSEASTPTTVHSQNYVEKNGAQLQHLDGLNNSTTGNTKRRMEEDCWAELSATGGPGTAATVVRDAFLGGGFVPHASPASPPSTTLSSSEFYETSSATNPILEGSLDSITVRPFPSTTDAFLAMPPNSLLDVRCGPFTTTAPSVDAASVHHFRDAGSVGISPCSSSTQISSISSSDDSSVHPLQQQLFPSPHYALHQHPSPSTAFASGIFHPSIYSLGHSLATVQQQQSHEDIGVSNGLMTFDKMEQNGHLQVQPPSHHGQDEGEHNESRDMKPSLFMVTELEQKQNQVEQHQQQLGAMFCADSEENGGFMMNALSPPPPPLTPPSKTRSKMHDLALKYRLITSQNVRGQGSIHLSAEEKRTLIQEGFPIPTQLPLEREEEEALKIVRRKIKNKLSAQESRRKRKEYMDMLEKRVHAYFADNTQLRQKVRQLEAQNRFLATQLQRVQQEQQPNEATTEKDGAAGGSSE